MLRQLIAVCLIAAVYCQVGGTSGPCSAIAIPGPFSEPISLFGSTVGASATAVDCNDDDLDGGVAWYSITPSAGVTVNITTCASYTNFDTIMVVYSGGCNSLSCVLIGDDGDCGIDSNFAAVSFTSSGQEYLIGVTGYGGTSGQFELTFSESGAATTSCQGAIHIPGPYTTPVTIYGNNANAPGYSQSDCGMSSSSHIDWYVINPAPGAQLEISTCNSVTNFDTQLAVLSGQCNGLTCFRHNDDNCTTANGYASYLSFVPTDPSLYLAVLGFSTNSGTYEVRISQHQGGNVGGVSCSSAILLPYAPGTTQNFFGTTLGNPVDTTTACNTQSSPAGWYRLDVPSSYSGTIRATTCGQGTAFDTIVSVYSGSCGTLACVTQNDDNCSTYTFASAVSWNTHSSTNFMEATNFATPSRSISGTSRPSPSRTPSAAGGTNTYFVVVTGFGGGAGNYDLQIQFQ